MENTEVMVVENEATEVAAVESTKLTGKETAGLVTVGALAIVGAVTVVKGGIKLGKKAYAKIKESQAVKDAEEKVEAAVEDAKTTISKKRKPKKDEVEDEAE